MTTTQTLFAIALHFGSNTEYMCFMNSTSSLLENAIHYEKIEDAKEALQNAKQFGDAEKWQVEYSIYEFEA